MKKFLALTLALVMSLSLVACGDKKTDDTKTDAPDQTEQPAENEGAYKVAMITDYGDITDQSFNQTTYEACKAFAEDNDIEFNYFKPVGDNTADRVAMIEKAADEGYNVIVMPGYAFGGAIVEAAPEFPDVKFIALDVAAGDLLETAVAKAGKTYDYTPDNWDLSEYVDMSNVYCAVYQEELCGYMAGYAAVKLGYKNLGFLGGILVGVAFLKKGFTLGRARTLPAGEGLVLPGIMVMLLVLLLAGPALLHFSEAGPGSMHLNFWTAPGETADIYVDLTEKGKSIVQRRGKERKASHDRKLYATGTYADLNMLYDMRAEKQIGFDFYTGKFADYRMTADEYAQMIVSKYKMLTDSVARSGMSEMMKELNLLSLKQEALCVMVTCSSLLEHNYRSVNNLWDRNAKIDYKFATLEPKHYAAVCGLFDINDPKLLMGEFEPDYRTAISYSAFDWADIIHAENGLVVDLRKAVPMAAKAANCELTEADLASLRSLKNPFYAEACEAIQARVRRELAALEGKVKIEETPDVAPDKLFDAIVAPCKGKVVLATVGYDEHEFEELIRTIEKTLGN